MKDLPRELKNALNIFHGKSYADRYSPAVTSALLVVVFALTAAGYELGPEYMEALFLILAPVVGYLIKQYGQV